MAKQKRLVDLIASELDQLNNHQKNAFRDELKRELPAFIQRTAQAVKTAEGDKQDANIIQPGG